MMRRLTAMISINMVHIAPWKAALGLLAGGKRLLRPDGVLFLYGPFMIGGRHTATTNATFDADLRQRNRRWGTRRRRHRQRGHVQRARTARGRRHAGEQSLPPCSSNRAGGL